MRFFKATAAAMIMMHGTQHLVWAADEVAASTDAVEEVNETSDMADEPALIAFKKERKSKKPHNEKHKYHDHCAEVCYKTRSCRSDRNSQGTYCKKDHHPSTCFGLYHRHHHEKDGEAEKDHDRKEKYCFQPNDPHCPENRPVLCGKHHRDEE